MTSEKTIYYVGQGALRPEVVARLQAAGFRVVEALPTPQTDPSADHPVDKPGPIILVNPHPTSEELSRLSARFAPSLSDKLGDKLGDKFFGQLATTAAEFPCFVFNCELGEDDAQDIVNWISAGLSPHPLRLRSQLESSTEAIDAEVKKLQELMQSYVNSQELRHVVLILQESLRNALEHGNCGISSAEKLAAIEAEQFDQLVKSKSLAARAAGAMIRFDSVISPTLLEFEIEDQGAGFDWRQLLKTLDLSKLAETVSGRGLLLTELLFDERSYNEKGNILRLRKRLS